ncbi:MAG: hypothetical protein K2L96_00360 [Muribaculaceae bacterium]|nr:hypothetical protein [Muribaculaceae bacterium]
MKISSLLKALLCALCITAVSCDNLDDTRVPAMPVHLVFQSVADWNAWGPGGAVDSRRFILNNGERVPAGYPFTALDRTGYGGLLVLQDVNGQTLVYDLSCPVECKTTVRVKVDAETLTAECPQCHSTYDVFSLYGHPLSGPAAKHGYGLRRYHATQGLSPYMVISN